MTNRIQLPNGVIDLPDGQDPQLYLLGRITQSQEDMRRGLDLLRREVRDLRETAVGRIGGVEAGLKILGTRFTMQVKSCGERMEKEEAFRRPWYTAVVGAVVAAAAGLLGALASLVLRGGTQ
jgi:hypothetical protein